MTKIKSFTDLQQSKKLAEILPIESADMYWMHGKLDNVKQHPTPNIIGNDHDEPLWDDYDIPCWSLAALLGVLPEIQGGKPIIALDDNYITYPHMSDLHTKVDNPVDACVAMIEKLHELNLL